MDTCAAVDFARALQVEEVKLDTAKVMFQIETSQQQTEVIRQQVAKMNFDRELLNHRANGVRSVSVSATQLCDFMIGEQIEPWFEAATCRFNAVTEEADGSFTAGDARQGTLFVQSGVKETSVQASWSSRFKNVIHLAATQDLNWWDGHSVRWLKRDQSDMHVLAPDAIAFVGNLPRSIPDYKEATRVAAIIDNKCSMQGKFNNEQKGHLFIYCETVLEFHQVSRPFLPCALFDGQFAQCYKVRRSPDRAYPFRADYTRVLDVAIAEDAALFAGFMTDRSAMEFHLEDQHPRAGEVVGFGATAVVFAHQDRADVVIKVPYRDQRFILSHERQVYVELANHQSTGLARLVAQPAGMQNCLVMEPKFSPLGKRVDSRLLCSLIDRPDAPVRILHSAQFVHCDLRPSNLMQSLVADRLAIVDLGAVRRISDFRPYEHGALVFASPKLRRAFFAMEPVGATPSDDLVSIAYCAIAFRYNVAESASKLPRTAHEIDAFWNQWSSDMFASRLLQCANDGCYAAMCTLIHGQYLEDVATNAQ